MTKNLPINLNNTIFSPFFGQKYFFQKIWLSRITTTRTTTLGPLPPWCVSENTNETIPRKLPDGRTEGQKDGQTLILRTLSVTAGVQFKKNPKSRF